MGGLDLIAVGHKVSRGARAGRLWGSWGGRWGWVVIGPGNRHRAGLVVLGGGLVMKPKRVRRPKKLWVKTRDLRNMEITDEIRMLVLCIAEVGRLTHDKPVELGFILPDVTIETGLSREKQFVYEARKQLNRWHRRLNSMFNGNANKRRFFHMRINGDRNNINEQQAMLREAMCAGLLVLNGQVQNFSQYEKAFHLREQEDAMKQQSSQKRSSERSFVGAAVAGFKNGPVSGVFE